MTDFEEKMLERFEKKRMIWWRYIDNIFFIWEHGEESLKVFIEQVNMFHSTIKLAAEYSKEEVNFLDENIKLIDGELKTYNLKQKPNFTTGSTITKKNRAFRKGNQKFPQKRFHAHYCLDDHSGIDDWNFEIFEQYETHEQLKEIETFWQHRLKTFYPIGLNEKEEYLY